MLKKKHFIYLARHYSLTFRQTRGPSVAPILAVPTDFNPGCVEMRCGCCRDSRLTENDTSI